MCKTPLLIICFLLPFFSVAQDSLAFCRFLSRFPLMKTPACIAFSKEEQEELDRGWPDSMSFVHLNHLMEK
ncbi:MAG TPA: hypothetical protein VFU15_04900 [Bacteroidia bacterium]|nr:hypothetical protein [Bacteroidia bacterium]